ncbi:zinc finger MYM-type protein 4 isoform X1 [Silurus asotus]|uniref:Zinc finger MYM-type protein 4 isoform X1 n=1 Tax=Silurus asotus TaxID=30991 RepID=A0AAD5A1Z1_SILAS|nr:zinc finger MYM-type protein 4 isoform X1 [Silurus asotus]
MDAAVPDDESASPDAVDHKDSKVSPSLDCEEHKPECREDAADVEMVENDDQKSHEDDDEAKKPESEGLKDVQEEYGMASKSEDEKKNNTRQEKENEKVPQQEESTASGDETLDKNVAEKNTDEMEENQETSEEQKDVAEVLEEESCEQDQEPKVIEEKRQDGRVGTVTPEVAAMDVGTMQTPETMETSEAMQTSETMETSEAMQTSETMEMSGPADVTTEHHANRDPKDRPKNLPEHMPKHPVHPRMKKKSTPHASVSAPVKIKDEPMDDEYENALGPQAPAGKIKDEPDTCEEFAQKTSEQIKISAVFSVGGSSTASGSTPAAAAANAPSVPSAAVSNPSSSSALCVVCSGCKKILLKGQTAFQRKGNPQLFCSPRCLCSSTSAETVPLPGARKICHYCLKGISNPKDVINATVDSTKSVKDFCSHKCLSAFNNKRDSANCALATKCSMCQKACSIRHEVNFMGAVHKLCSDLCFRQFRASNKLSMSSCETCGVYCYSDGKSPCLIVDGAAKKFCSQNCVSAFKKKYTKVVPCTMCRVYRPLTEMVENLNTEGNTELFCSSTCVTAHKVQTVSSSGRLQQDDAFNKTHPQSSQTSGAPALSTAQMTSVQSVPAEPSSPALPQGLSGTKFSCAQCPCLFFSKPELLEFKGKMYVFCGKTCTDEFRRSHYIMAQCVYCKIEKVVKEVKRINNSDCSFCSEGCKLLYKHDLAKFWGKRHCRNCLYCSSTSQTVMTSIFSGKQEEFCGKECLSQYTLLFCEVAQCSMCKRGRKMTESVKWLNEMKHFCNLKCLMHFCNLHACTSVALGSHPSALPVSIAPATHSGVSSITTLSSLASKESTPVIANVISLSSATNGQPNVLGNAALQGTVPTVVKLIGNASTQTDGVKPPSAPPRILKNKALLCKPMSQNKGTSCKPNTSSIHTQTDETPPKVIVIPLPVPVFVPVPVHLYTQYTPHPLGLPFPVPVPMFLPTTLDSAERIVETIQKIKEKIPDNPLEADLIMMAEMVAEDSEKDNAVSQGDHEDNFMEDFDLEALSSHLSWEDDSISSASRWGRSSESERVAPSRQEQQSPSSLPYEPQMDLEADFPIESFEHLERHPQEDKGVAATRPKTRKRNRDCFSSKKRARKRAEAPQTSAAEVQPLTRLHTEYGVQAWRSWVRWRETQPQMEMPKIGTRNIRIQEDLLQCSMAELSYGLCKFIAEVRRPNGEAYTPDSIFYLCLGVQQQLGAFSPSVLLNTLLYLCTKFYNFKTVAQHRRLSFAHIMRCTRSQADGTKVSCLRFYPPAHKDDKTTPNEDQDGVPAKRKKEDDEDEEGVVLEMQENIENPLRCPVRLYEFYLSKCSATVKQRTSVFYLRPERSCVPNSPLWFSQVALGDGELENMLRRILTVREIHLEREKPPDVSELATQSDSE